MKTWQFITLTIILVATIVMHYITARYEYIKIPENKNFYGYVLCIDHWKGIEWYAVHAADGWSPVKVNQ